MTTIAEQDQHVRAATMRMPQLVLAMMRADLEQSNKYGNPDSGMAHTIPSMDGHTGGKP